MYLYFLISCVIVAVCRRDHRSGQMYSHYPLILLPSCPLISLSYPLVPFSLKTLEFITIISFIIILLGIDSVCYRDCVQVRNQERKSVPSFYSFTFLTFWFLYSLTLWSGSPPVPFSPQTFEVLTTTSLLPYVLYIHFWCYCDCAKARPQKRATGPSHYPLTPLPSCPLSSCPLLFSLGVITITSLVTLCFCDFAKERPQERTTPLSPCPLFSYLCVLLLSYPFYHTAIKSITLCPYFPCRSISLYLLSLCPLHIIICVSFASAYERLRSKHALAHPSLFEVLLCISVIPCLRSAFF